MYDDGKVLIVGGGAPPTATAEVIDLNSASPSWRSVAPMSTPRRQLNSTLLPDGKVLVTGGSSGDGFDNSTEPVLAAEIWDPATESWTTLASSNTIYRGYHSIAMLLPDGRVLTGGGDDFPTVEFYHPPYLFKTWPPRPTITSAPATVGYGETFLVKTPNPASITAVNWIRLSSVTHSFNQNQRINRLSFSEATEGVNVTAPASGKLCPPGHYMLFILAGISIL